MPGVVRWIAVHRKTVVFVAGLALTIAIQVWGTDNPYVSLAVLVATGLGVYHAPNEPAPAKAPAGTGAEPARVTPPPEPVITVPAAGHQGGPGTPPGQTPASAAGTGGFPPSAFPGQP